jgi:hypothetical protein
MSVLLVVDDRRLMECFASVNRGSRSIYESRVVQVAQQTPAIG